MGLPRSPGPSTSNAPVRDSDTEGAPPISNPPEEEAAVASAGVAPSPEPEMIRFFRQEADRMHTAATILTEVTEDMLRDGFRQLTRSKGDIDAASMAGTISKSAFLRAKKRYNAARTAVLHKVLKV